MFLPWKMSRTVVGKMLHEGSIEGGIQTGTGTKALGSLVRFASLATVTSVIAGCGTGVLSEGITGLSDSVVGLDAGQTYTFRAQTVGAPSVSWSLAGNDCTGTSCGQLSSTTGGSVQYTAPVSVTKQQNVTLKATTTGTGAEGTTATIALNPHLSMSGTALPSTVAGAAYSTKLSVTGGMTPYRWSVTSGSLPSGVTLNASTGVISGSPLMTGSFAFTVQVADASAVSATTQASFAMSVAAPNTPLSVATNALVRGTAEASYTTQLQALGGLPPYSFSVAAGSLPTGLTLSSTGVLAGTPHTAGTTAVTVRVTDASQPAGSAAAALTISILPVPLTIASTLLPSATVGAAYSSPIAISGGVAPYTCSLTNGALAKGLTMNGCAVSGTATESGNVSATVQVTDSGSPVSQVAESLHMSVLAAPLSFGTTTLPAATVGLSYNAAITAVGGTAPYTCTISSGSLPSGLTLNGCAITGRLTGANGSSFNIRVTDAGAPAKTVTGRFTIALAAEPLVLLSTSLANGTVGLTYSTNIALLGGIGPYHCSATGGTLPAGLELNGCTVRGVPSSPGSGTVTIQVTDAQSPAYSTIGVMRWSIAGAGLSLLNGAFPNGTAGMPYSGAVTVSGGTAPYSCSLTAGSLPSGLALNGCTVSGTPKAAAVAPITIRVTDAGSPAASVTGSYVISIAPAALALTTASLPAATVGVPYSFGLSATGGTAPYSCSIAGGALPSGLVLNGCQVSGTPTVSGASKVTIRIADASTPALAVSGSLSVTVAATPLVMQTAKLPNGTVGAGYAATILATGGTAPYTCALTSGTMPAGLTMNGCSISGSPSVSGTTALAMKVTDSSAPAMSVSSSLSLTIRPAALALAPTTLPNGTVGTALSASIAASGGTAPYTCRIASGALPTGLDLAGCTVTGVPSQAGSGSVTVQVTDSESPASSVSGPVSWSITGPKLSLMTSSLPATSVGASYSDALAITGGTAPYTCAISGGTLPAGLALSGDCKISGKATSAGAGSVTIKVTDAASPVAQASGVVSWTVGAPALVLASSNLPKAVLGTPYSGTIAISGGTAPYTCAISGGALPSGLSLNGCAVTGTPTAAGSQTITIRVSDASTPTQAVSGSVGVLVSPAGLNLLTTALTPGKVHAQYSSTLTISGGIAPYACSVSAGSLPAGLSLNGCGVSGTPTAAGTSTLTVQVADAASPAQTAAGTLTVTVAPAALAVATTTLPNGTASVFYSSSIAANGGTAPYTCSLTGGVLPAGLAMNGCAVTGTPTAAASAAMTVKITDAGTPAQTATGAINLTIAPAVLTLANATMPAGVAGQRYAGSMTATGGTAPYSYSVTSGSLPAGLALGADGSIGGVPTTTGVASFTAQVTDAGSPQMSATHVFSITVAVPALTLNAATLPSGTAGQAYSATIPVTGGTAPYNCSLVSGALPVGLALNGCSISGTGAAAGTASVVVRATDASSPVQSASGTVTVAVNAAALSITTTKLPSATLNTAYSASIGVSGGVGAISCALGTGTLPAGLHLNGPTCALSGTPTSAGTSSVTIAATDSNKPTPNVASAALAVVVSGAPMSVVTTQIPNPVLGQAYTQALQVTGGQAPYSFAIAGGALPTGLALSASGVISGSPTAAGASSITVSVTDSAATPQTTTQTLVPMVVYPAGANNAQLSGPFAFLVQQFDAAANGDLPYQSASVGSFTADGAGLVQNGEMDSNHQSSSATGTVQPAHFIGTYEVGADDRGLLTITPINSDGSTGTSSTYAIAAAAEVAADGSATAANIAAAGGNPMQTTGAPGMLLAQDKTAIAQALNGSYAFGLEGDTPCLKTCVIGLTGGPVAEVGQFTANGAGAIVSGTADSNIGTVNNAHASLSGSYGTADGNGRVSVVLNTANEPAGVYPTNYSAYVVDANEVLVMSADTHATHVLLSGTAELQTQSSFSNASMSGAVLGAVNATVDPVSLGVSLASVSSSATATVFRTTATADGNCSVTNVDVAGAAQLTAAVTSTGNNGVGIAALLGSRQATGAVTCAVAANGRGVLTAAQPSATVGSALSATGLTTIAEASRVFYLTAPGRGYFLETGNAALGSFEPQQAGTFNAQSVDGVYDLGTGAPSSAATVGSSGVISANGAGSATLTPDAGLGSGGQMQAGPNQTVAYSLTDATAGRFTMNTAVLYALSPDRLLRLDLDPSTASPTVGSMQR